MATLSGADVADDSPRRAENPLLDGPFLVDDAETEVCRVLDPSGVERPWDLRALRPVDVVGTFRISCFKTGSWARVSRTRDAMDRRPTQKGRGIPRGLHSVATACVSSEKPRTLSVCSSH